MHFNAKFLAHAINPNAKLDLSFCCHHGEQGARRALVVSHIRHEDKLLVTNEIANQFVADFVRSFDFVGIRVELIRPVSAIDALDTCYIVVNFHSVQQVDL